MLLADPQVHAAAVVGWPDEVLGQVPVAAVVSDSADPVALVARLDEACTAALDRVRRPVRYHLLDALPGGVNGKVARPAVLRLLQEPGAAPGLAPTAPVRR